MNMINCILLGVDTLFIVDIPRTGAGESIIHKDKLDFTTNGV